MKKIYLCALSIFWFSTITAQTIHTRPLKKIVEANYGSRTVGDTLMYMPLPDYTVNSVDAPVFTVQVEDVDVNQPDSPYSNDFGLYYSTDSSYAGTYPTKDNFYHTWEVPAPAGNDTAFFWSATSSFLTPSQANNWLMFGPITIPTNGVTLIWYDRGDQGRDGYQVKICDYSNASTPLVYSDFDFGSVIFNEIDDDFPSATYATDTTWELRSCFIPAAYAGQMLCFAFNHNATDIDVLHLDEITVIDGNLNCHASFSLTQDTINLFNYYAFNTSSNGSQYSYLWDFGDSTTSTLQYPTHNYSWSGPFQLCLTVTDTSGCSDTFCDSLAAGRSSTGITLTVVPPLVTGIKESGIKEDFIIFPSPVNSSATIRYELAENSFVNISLYDLIGNKIATLKSEKANAGKHDLMWNTEDLSSGMYLLQMNASGKTSTKKILISH